MSDPGRAVYDACFYERLEDWAADSQATGRWASGKRKDRRILCLFIPSFCSWNSNSSVIVQVGDASGLYL